MKKIVHLGIGMLLLIGLSCSSGSDNGDLMEPDNEVTDPGTDPGSGDPEPDPDPVSFAADIEPILQANCISCHDDPPTQNAPMPLLTLEQVADAVNNRNLLGRMNSTTRPMPPSGRLPLATRQLIEDWIDLGLPE